MSWQLVSAVRLRGYSNLGVPQEPLGGLLESRVQISAVMIFRVAGLSSRIYPHAGPLRCNRECVQAVWKKTKLWLCARGPRRGGDGEDSRLAGAPPGCPVLSHVYLRIWNPVLLLHRKSSWAPSLWAPAMRRGSGDWGTRRMGWRMKEVQIWSAVDLSLTSIKKKEKKNVLSLFR